MCKVMSFRAILNVRNEEEEDDYREGYRYRMSEVIVPTNMSEQAPVKEEQNETTEANSMKNGEVGNTSTGISVVGNEAAAITTTSPINPSPLPEPSTNTPTPHVQQNDNSQLESAVDKEVIDLEEKRKREYLGNMEKIEKEFAELKEKFFNDKIESLKREHEMIKNGTHQGFLKKCRELEQTKEQKIWAADKWREYQTQNIEHLFEAETKQLEDEFKADKKALKERMLNSTLEKKKKLMEEKNSMSLSIQDGAERIVTRTLRKRGSPKDSKEQGPYKRRLNPPYIHYTLKEGEILEDLNLIQKAASSHPTYGRFVMNTESSSRSSGNSSAVSSPPSVVHSDVYTDRGKLYYYNQVFERGREVLIEAKQDKWEQQTNKWQGSLVVVNPSEIHVKSSDGTKSRFPVSQLKSGKYTISALS